MVSGSGNQSTVNEEQELGEITEGKSYWGKEGRKSSFKYLKSH